ncbi:aminotransferase class I/II-fold pyridoxal phosphate-dependent enzyme [Sediminibacterium soli]|uniref:aminotransferase class I/II-fold pyridoxal phosphate-dependent enzyme n=1 Tax=Sediminibacterium soli TaxID=2698829 RepID=UPI00137AE89B|nr:8-amino-7-oxononanoate synthase [Sediminibacterium soli]NCI45853.1 8-amino-7-oxononanoate synthase [Sediminibacterium soli]
MYPDDFLQKKLQERKQRQAFRSLSLPGTGIDFCSNDYLGIARNALLQTPGHGWSAGSTGSRLLSGNYALIVQAEEELADFHQADAALIFNSGYDANTGLLSCIPQKGDTVLYDQLCHASIRDGIRLSFAGAFAFAHNDLTDLQKKLERAAGNCFIVTESVFSMDGDTCPAEALVALAEKYGAHLVIDEAHATGVIGNRGEGLVQSLSLQQRVFARIHTFGKACGCHGAVVLGSVALREYLVNFARSFVFTTALPEQSIAHIRRSYQLFPAMTEERERLAGLVRVFQNAAMPYTRLASQTPIQGIVVPGNENARKLAYRLQQKGLDIRPILYPTVPAGMERLRIVLHAFNTREEMDLLTGELQREYAGVL